LALKLMGLGYKKVYALKGGWKAWDAAGYPVEKK
jgi:3-mercaptopyruvate sulfurtransferase SseA